MARTNKSLVSDFIKDMLFNSQPQDVEAKFSKKIVSVMKDSDFWKTTVITKDNKSSISKNISVNVSVGDIIAYNSKPFNVIKKGTGSSTITANVKTGKVISVTKKKSDAHLMYVL